MATSSELRLQKTAREQEKADALEKIDRLEKAAEKIGTELMDGLPMLRQQVDGLRTKGDSEWQGNRRDEYEALIGECQNFDWWGTGFMNEIKNYNNSVQYLQDAIGEKIIDLYRGVNVLEASITGLGQTIEAVEKEKAAISAAAAIN